jgi:hypothetical protein
MQATATGTNIESLTQLAAIRQQMYDSFNSKTVDDEAVDLPEFNRITAIEAKIVKAVFSTAADLSIGLQILFNGDDPEPERWCPFKIAVYRRMQKFA